MSHSNTTQQTPQWAIDAANAVNVQTQLHLRDTSKIAVIIARHAPKHGDSFNDLHRYATDRDARIAELEAENERFCKAVSVLSSSRDRIMVLSQPNDMTLTGMREALSDIYAEAYNTTED